jgi:siroheme synthase-like protein
MLPIILNPDHVRIVVFGYGRASRIKVEGIARSGMKCHVISKTLENVMTNAVIHDNISFEEGAYHVDQLSKGDIVIAATDDLNLNKQITVDARLNGKLVLNLSDGPASDFHMMSWRKKGTVTVGLSTGNCAPKESKRLIELLMDTVDDETVERIGLLGQLRKKIKTLGYSPLKPIVNRLADMDIEELENYNDLPLEALADEIKKRV